MSNSISSGKFRFALVGAGMIANHHAKVIRDLADQIDLVAVVNRTLEKAEKITTVHGGQAFSSLTDAIAATDIDVVVICTPPGGRAEVAIEALEADKHLIIEKPAEVSLSKIDDIIAAQQKSGTLVTVISQHRFDPASEVALAAIKNGELGRLTSGIASIDWWRDQSYYDSGGWRGTWEFEGGGALMNQGVHTVDLLVAMLGRPVEVFGCTAILAHERIETEDVAVGVVRFESGALGVLHATTAAFPGLSARVQVHGDKGSIVIEDDELSFIHVTRKESADAEQLSGSEDGATNQVAEYALPEEDAATAGRDPSELSDAHHYQYENFLAALRGTGKIRVGLAENRQTVSVIVGLYESARTGKPVWISTEFGHRA
jgi:UDP-N-acetyl-2-amino-2-deoxyglucuronate dehydrogenase